MRVFLSAGMALVALGCGVSEPVVCPAVLIPSGVGVEIVDSDQWPQVASVAVTMCEQRRCTTGEATPLPPVPRRVFVQLPLSDEQADFRLVLADGHGTALINRNITATPHTSFPHGPECPATTRLQMVVSGDGEVTARGE